MRKENKKALLLSILAVLIVSVVLVGPLMLGRQQLEENESDLERATGSEQGTEDSARGAEAETGGTVSGIDRVTPSLLEALGKPTETKKKTGETVSPLPESAVLRTEILDRAAEIRSVREEVHLTGFTAQNGQKESYDQVFYLDYYPQTKDMIQMVQDRDGQVFSLVKKDGNLYSSRDMKSFEPYDEEKGDPVIFHYPDFLSFLEDDAMTLQEEGDKNRFSYIYRGDRADYRSIAADLFGLDADSPAGLVGAEVELELNFKRDKKDLESGFIVLRSGNEEDGLKLRYDFTFSHFNNLRMLGSVAVKP